MQSWLSPDAVAEALDQVHLRDDQHDWVVRCVPRYSPKLAGLVIKRAQICAKMLLPRNGPPCEATMAPAHHHCSAICHTLDLLEQSQEPDPTSRAALRIIHAVLLVHLHANIIPVMHSRGLLDLEANYAAAAYTSREAFQVVERARTLAKEAMDQALASGQPGTDTAGSLLGTVIADFVHGYRASLPLTNLYRSGRHNGV